ncbi:MAG: endolytic transglycosylase MltG [Nocardioides sp.]
MSTEDLAVDSPYNTRLLRGPAAGADRGPRAGRDEGVVNPADGPWYYYVTVNLKTGKTKFAETYDQFLQYKAELDAYCQTSDAC